MKSNFFLFLIILVVFFSFKMKVQNKEMKNDFSIQRDTIPYNIVATKPIFVACSDVPVEKQHECVKKYLDEFVRLNQRYSEESQEVQGRVFVSFLIDKEGGVKVLTMRGPHKSLEEDARRVIEKLPRFIPAKDAHGKPVAVIFTYPVLYKVNY